MEINADRISRSPVFRRVTALKCFATFTEKHQKWSHFYNFCLPTFAILLCTGLYHRSFTLNFAKFLKTTFKYETSGRATDSEISTRSSCSQMFLNVDVLKNFVIFTGKHLCWSIFPVNIAKFLRTAFYRTPLLAASVVLNL